MTEEDDAADTELRSDGNVEPAVAIEQHRVRAI